MTGQNLYYEQSVRTTRAGLVKGRAESRMPETTVTSLEQRHDPMKSLAVIRIICND